MTRPDGRADDELLRATGTDPDAFAAFYTRHAAGVFAYFVTRLDRTDLAADLTAEVFAAAFEAAAAGRPAVHPGAWLYGIARHKLLDSLRRGRVENEARARLGMPPITLTDLELERAEARVDVAAETQQLHRLLAGLPVTERDALLAHRRRAGLRRARGAVAVLRGTHPQARIARPAPSPRRLRRRLVTNDFFAKLERQLRVVARDHARTSSLRERSRRSRRLAAIALAALAIGGAAAGASGLLPVGSRVPVENMRPGHPGGLGPRVVVATGQTPILGRWQMFWSRSSAGECHEIQLLDEPGPAAGAVGGGCGGPTGLTVSAVIPIPTAARAETLMHGRTPGDVKRVRVAIPGLGARTVEVEDGPAGIAGNWYLASFAGVPAAGDATVQPLDDDGREVGYPATLPISLHPRYPSPSPIYLGGDRIRVSRGGLVPVPLACRRQPEREGKCIGTATIRVRGSRLGWQWIRLSPGTKRRVVHVRLAPDLRRRIAREGSVVGSLSWGAGRRRIRLLAP